MADIKSKYPAANADSAALTITLASLATSSTLRVGREATAIVNTSDLDLDKPITGLITVGTTPVVGTVIEIWATMPLKITAGAAAWGDSMTGSDAAFTCTSDPTKFGMFRLVASIAVDSATSNRGYPFVGNSIASLFPSVPAMLNFFATHNTGVNLNATAGNHYIHLHRWQAQLV